MKKDFKSVPIEKSVWRELHQEKLDTGRDLYLLIEKAWNSYKGVAKEQPQVIADSPLGSLSKPESDQLRILLDILRGSNNDQRGLLDLALKLHKNTKLEVPNAGKEAASSSRVNKRRAS